MSNFFSFISRPFKGKKNAPRAGERKFGLTQLEQTNKPSISPEDASASSSQQTYPVDIVAVHGITGDAYDTWTAVNNILWLKDFLLEDLPEARVFTYGYDARVFFTKATGTLDSFAITLLESLIQRRTRPVGLASSCDCHTR
jgi:hypothetical protein